VRHAQQQTELDSEAARDCVQISRRNSRSRSVSDGGQTSQHDDGTRLQVSEPRSKVDDSSGAVPLRPPAETRAATGPCDPTLRMPQGASAMPGTERGSDGHQRALENGGDVAQQQHATPEAAPAIASLIAQLAAALRTAVLACPPADGVDGVPLRPDTCCTGRRHGVQFLTIAPLPSARKDEPSAADRSTRREAGNGCAVRALAHLPADVEPNTTAAVTQSAATAGGLPAQLPPHTATQPLSERAQDTAERQQADSSQVAAGVEQADTDTVPHVKSAPERNVSLAAAADKHVRHSPAQREHAAASKEPADNGQDAAAPPAVPIRWTWRGISDERTCSSCSRQL